MRRMLIRYKTKPELADSNAALVAAVFAELKAARPDGVASNGRSGRSRATCRAIPGPLLYS